MEDNIQNRIPNSLIQFSSENCEFYVNENFMDLNCFLGEEFDEYIPDFFRIVFDEHKAKCAVLDIDYIVIDKNNQEKLKNYIENYEKHRNLICYLFSEDYFIISNPEIKEKLNKDKDYFEKIFSEEIRIFNEHILQERLKDNEELKKAKAELERLDEEERLKKLYIMIPEIKNVNLNELTTNSVKISFNQLDHQFILNKNRNIIKAFHKEYKDTPIEYFILFFNKNKQEKQKFETISNNEIKDGKIFFELKNLSSNSLYIFKILIKFDRFYSNPKNNYFFQTLPENFSDIFVYGDNQNNLLLMNEKNYSPSNLNKKYDELVTENFIKTPLKLKGKNIDFATNIHSTILLTSDYNLIQSGEFYYETKTNKHDFDLTTTENVSIQNSTPFKISFFDTIKIKKITLGLEHFLALSFLGELYSWGHNKYGQLGLSLDTNYVTGIPKKIKFINDEIKYFYVYDICSGNNSNMALTLNNYGNKNLFTWGFCMGIERSNYSVITEDFISTKPVVFKNENENIKKIFSGNNLNGILCEGKENVNELFLFGVNLYGEMGISTKINRHLIPKKLNFINENKLNVKDVIFGKKCTLILCENVNKEKELFYSGICPLNNFKQVENFIKYENSWVKNIIKIYIENSNLFVILDNKEIIKIEKENEIKNIKIEGYDEIKNYSWNFDNIKFEGTDDDFILMIK